MKAPRFAAFKNYGKLLEDNRLVRSITNTLFCAGATVPAGVVTSLMLATLSTGTCGASTPIRALFYMPIVSPIPLMIPEARSTPHCQLGHTDPLPPSYGEGQPGPTSLSGCREKTETPNLPTLKRPS